MKIIPSFRGPAPACPARWRPVRNLRSQRSLSASSTATTALKRLIELRLRASSCAMKSACCRKLLMHSSTMAAVAALSPRQQRPLKSLSDMLKGKQGRFPPSARTARQARRLFRPSFMSPPSGTQASSMRPAEEDALELFKPFIYARLDAKGFLVHRQAGQEACRKGKAEDWDISTKSS